MLYFNGTGVKNFLFSLKGKPSVICKIPYVVYALSNHQIFSLGLFLNTKSETYIYIYIYTFVYLLCQDPFMAVQKNQKN